MADLGLSSARVADNPPTPITVDAWRTGWRAGLAGEPMWPPGGATPLIPWIEGWFAGQLTRERRTRVPSA